MGPGEAWITPLRLRSFVLITLRLNGPLGQEVLDRRTWELRPLKVLGTLTVVLVPLYIVVPFGYTNLVSKNKLCLGLLNQSPALLYP